MHGEDVVAGEGDQKAATKVREIEKTDYQAEHMDITQSIEALGVGVDTMKAEAHDMAQSVLVQIAQLPKVPDEARKTLPGPGLPG